LGLIAYKVLTNHLPEWPFDWPPPGYAILRRKLHPDMIDLLRRAIELRPTRRFRDANEMLVAFRRIKPRTMRFAAARSAKK
jgi:serine/threonine-protein kinase